MKELRITAVSYLNTLPFVYGITQSGFLGNYSLRLDVPSVCAENLKNGSANIGLIPVGALPDFTGYEFVSDFCVGATGEVRTVLLLSTVPLESIKKIGLDHDSRTSVRLVRILAEKLWNIYPEWEDLKEIPAPHPGEPASVVAIGDKTFGLRKQYPYCYDLSAEWVRYTSLPFVFAVWISREPLPAGIRESFSRALAYGIARKPECLDFFSDRLPPCKDCLEYLEKNISYEFDDRKKEGLARFLSHIR